MRTRKVLLTAIVIAVVLVALGYALVQNGTAPAHDQGDVEDRAAAYVREHISQLSPEKEVLGGTFYVTDLSVSGNGGTVSYEDGHNTYTADFTYDATEDSIAIQTFTIR